jgi:hypothetical protein
MTTTNNHRPEPRNVVEEVRAARAAVAEQAGGLARLGEYLRRVQEEYGTRTGRFAGVPLSRPAEVQRLIDAALTGDPLLDELRSIRGRNSTR